MTNMICQNEVKYYSSYCGLDSFLQATSSKRLQGHSLRFMVRKDSSASGKNMRIHCGASFVDETLMS